MSFDVRGRIPTVHVVQQSRCSADPAERSFTLCSATHFSFAFSSQTDNKVRCRSPSSYDPYSAASKSRWSTGQAIACVPVWSEGLRRRLRLCKILPCPKSRSSRRLRFRRNILPRTTCLSQSSCWIRKRRKAFNLKMRSSLVPTQMTVQVKYCGAALRGAQGYRHPIWYRRSNPLARLSLRCS